SWFDDDQRNIVLSSLGLQWRDPKPMEEWFEKHLPWTHLGKSPGLAVVDLATGRQRFGVLQWAPLVGLSGDGTTLATCRPSRRDDGEFAFWRVEIWDVRPHRALFWSVTTCVALSIAGLLLRRILPAWHKNQSFSLAFPPSPRAEVAQPERPM